MMSALQPWICFLHDTRRCSVLERLGLHRQLCANVQRSDCLRRVIPNNTQSAARNSTSHWARLRLDDGRRRLQCMPVLDITSNTHTCMRSRQMWQGMVGLDPPDAALTKSTTNPMVSDFCVQGYILVQASAEPHWVIILSKSY